MLVSYSSLSILTDVVHLNIFTGLPPKDPETIFWKCLENQLRGNYTSKFCPPHEKDLFDRRDELLW